MEVSKLFCPDCGFILFLKQNCDDQDEPIDNTLLNYCKNCNFNTLFEHSNKVVFKKKYGDTYQVQKNINNDYLIYDPTLPRISNIDCINVNCISNSDEEDSPTNEILFIKFDEENMKYLYLCKHCKTSWTNK